MDLIDGFISNYLLTLVGLLEFVAVFRGKEREGEGEEVGGSERGTMSGEGRERGGKGNGGQ